MVSVTVARRREDAEGWFDGALIGSILPGYVQAQWHAMDPSGRASFALLRTDGQVPVTPPP